MIMRVYFKVGYMVAEPSSAKTLSLSDSLTVDEAR